MAAETILEAAATRITRITKAVYEKSDCHRASNALPSALTGRLSQMQQFVVLIVLSGVLPDFQLCAKVWRAANYALKYGS
jgi:hypothetical protein